MKNPLLGDKTEALPRPYRTPPAPEGARPTPATLNLVRAQVRALLEASPAFRRLAQPARHRMAHDLVKIAAYSAALIQDEWALAQKLGQTPVLRHQRTLLAPPLGQVAEARAQPNAASGGADASLAARTAAADEFSPRAAGQVARITQQTLNAIAFPTFVADLIKGTFQAIIDASIQQMEAYAALLANVAKTVDQFMADNITDNQARDFLAESYPGHFRVDTEGDTPRLRVRRNAEDLPLPNFQRQFSLAEEFTDLDEDAVEETLVPAARRKLASNRHQVLATMVMMGINRIVVTSGRIRAEMGFRIDASDQGRVETARDFDFQNTTSASAGGGIFSFFGQPSVRTTTTVAYVSSTKKESSDELNVEADLTGEVELKFKSDYLPLQRMATPEMIAAIQGNTPNPAANRPATGSGEAERSESTTTA
jgi:hypothetical protein